MENRSAIEWCDEVLKENEDLVREWAELRFTGDELSILKKARLNRAETKKTMSDIKASAATLVQQLMHDVDRGVVTLEIPGIDLEVRLTWK